MANLFQGGCPLFTALLYLRHESVAHGARIPSIWKEGVKVRVA